MKIRLINFRCYSDKEFELGDKGLTLISGMSGKGKSTILLGINFALFGKGNKLIKVGEKSCKVILNINGMKIERSKRPNRLLVDDVYEDAAAQSIIDKRFGNNFNIAGYISQDSMNSFIMMSPTEKLLFLEKFALEDIDLNDKKNKCKALIKRRKEDLIAITSKLELSNELFESMEKPTKVDFPKKTKNKDKYKKNESIRLKNCNTKIKKHNKRIKSLEKEQTEFLLLNDRVKSIEKNILEIDREKRDKKDMLSNISIISKEDISVKENFLQRCINNREYISCFKQYEKDKELLISMKEKEKVSMENELKDIINSLWVEYEKDEIDEEIHELIECLDNMKKLKLLNKQISSLEKNIISKDEYENTRLKLETSKKDLDTNKQLSQLLKLQQECYSCPSCEEILCFRNNKLEISDNVEKIQEGSIKDVNSLIKKLNRDIKKCEDVIINYENSNANRSKILEDIEEIKNKYEDTYNLEDLKESIDSLKEYKRDSLRMEKDKEKLEEKILNEVYSTTIQKFSEKVDKLERKLKYLEVEDPTELENVDEEELRKELNTMKNSRKEYQRTNIDIGNLTEKLRKLRKEKENCINAFNEKYQDIRDVEDINNMIKDINKEISMLETQIQTHTKNLEQIERYNKYKEDLQTYKDFESKVIEYSKQEKLCRDKYTSSQLLLSKILSAESIAIGNVIDNINLHVQYFLDKFFQDDTISIRLKAYKEVKKSKKPQINLEIYYKDMDCDINMLSGGERSRVILAFTLALGEMFNIPLLMLDESTASLDQDLTTIVFNGIRENFQEKIVLIIAHQIITGVFDKIINL